MLGVYVHIPFCNSICTYCDFCKTLYNKQYVTKYLDSLEKEICGRYKGEEIDSIYIGGGTPSCLDVAELDRLFSILSIIKLKDNYEYTIECNIESIDIYKINLFKSYGINRISFGVESFDSDIQKILGRSHNEDLIFDNIYMTKKYFDNINIDLIYGVNDNMDIVKSDILKFLELDIPHISCYSLIIEEHTKLCIDKHKYIDQDIDNEIYNYIRNTLAKNGYKHYEISNYGRLRRTGQRKFLKGSVKEGYVRISIRTKDGDQSKFVHRLVAEAFIPNPQNKEIVDHIDGNRANNHVSNLRWVTAEENSNNIHRLKLLSEQAEKRKTDKLINDSLKAIFDTGLTKLDLIQRILDYNQISHKD